MAYAGKPGCGIRDRTKEERKTRHVHEIDA